MSRLTSASVLLAAVSAFALLFAVFANRQAPLQKPPAGGPVKTLPLSAIPGAFANTSRPKQNTDAITQIRQTLNMYPFLVDGKQFDKLDLVFHEDIWANYSALIGAFHPLSVLKEGLEKAVAAVTTQHLLGTQLIDVAEDGNTARSATMFYASHFGTGDLWGQSVWAWGTYQDYWVRNENTGEWRILQRAMDYPGENGQVPLFGNVSVLRFA